MQILITEDDLSSRTILVAFVRKWGYEALVAHDGEAAWEILQRPDAPLLILLDWILPGMDGIEVIRRVRALKTNQPPYIIMVTGKSDKSDIITGLDAGANDYVQKPFDAEELRTRIRGGQRLLDMQQKINEAQKMINLGAMAAGVAHEINSPLQVVTGVLGRLRRNNLIMSDATVLDDIEMAYRNSWRIAQITRALLAYLQVIPMKISCHNPNEIVERTISTYSPNIASHITLRAELDPDLPELMCDQESFQQALSKLLENALEAVADGGEVVVRTAYQPEERLLILQVSDTGRVGIAPEYQDRVFDPFFTTQPPGKGTGLGLSIVMGVVKAHSGKVSFESQPGQGTTFTIQLPYAPVPAGDESA